MERQSAHKNSLPTYYDYNRIWTLYQIFKKNVISLILPYFKISYLTDIGFSSIFHILRILLLVFSTTNLPLIYFFAYRFFCYLDGVITDNYYHCFYLKLNEKRKKKKRRKRVVAF